MTERTYDKRMTKAVADRNLHYLQGISDIDNMKDNIRDLLWIIECQQCTLNGFDHWVGNAARFVSNIEVRQIMPPDPRDET